MHDTAPDRTITIITSHGLRHVASDDIIHFPEGLPGFEDFTDFAFFDIEDAPPFKSMLSVVEGGPDFIVIESGHITEDYIQVTLDAACAALAGGEADEYAVLSIITVADDPGKSTVNLRGPIIVNLTSHEAIQIILDNDEYPSRSPLVPLSG